MIRPRPGSVLLVRLFGSAVLTQALLSATSLVVGLILLRRTTDLQYGYYVLMQNAVLLMTILQNSFIQPQLVTRMSKDNTAARADAVGGLYRDQRRLLPFVAGVILVLTAVLWGIGKLETPTAAVMLATGAAVVATLYREFFRMVLLGLRKPVDVLRGDSVYVTLVIGGILLSTLTPAPAAIAGLTLAIAAAVSGWLCSRALWRFEPWNIRGDPGILRSFMPLGTWATTGAATHWVLNQGYSYLVAGILDVRAVAAIAATRLTIMPINLLSSGIGTVMLPTTADWVERHGALKVLGRSLRFALLLSTGAICYLAVIWLIRDWLFISVLKKQFAQRDTLLALWFAVGLIMLVRDQLIYLLTVRHRFRQLTTLTLLNALISLSVSYVGMRYFGLIAALWGILLGEALNVIGLAVLSVLEVRRQAPPATAQESAR